MMALKEIEIEELLRGDLSDIDEFDDDNDYDEKTIIYQQIVKMSEFIDHNNAEIDKMDREQCLLRGDLSVTTDLVNKFMEDNADECVLEENSNVQLPAKWIKGSWENKKYPFYGEISDPPVVPSTPLEYFKQLFDSKIVENIVYQTNLYSTQKSGTASIQI